jgi:hypothetical protein
MRGGAAELGVRIDGGAFEGVSIVVVGVAFSFFRSVVLGVDGGSSLTSGAKGKMTGTLVEVFLGLLHLFY